MPIHQNHIDTTVLSNRLTIVKLGLIDLRELVDLIKLLQVNRIARRAGRGSADVARLQQQCHRAASTA
jgi:hypothetical protein